MSSHFITGLDIGSTSIKVAVLERRGNQVVLRAMFKEPSQGLRKGTVVDAQEAAHAVRRVLDEVKKISKTALKNIYVNIGTPQVKVQNSRGIVAVSRVDNEIYQDDIDRAIRASEAVSITPNRLVVHNITREFIVDGVADVGNPLGLSGSRLEVTSMIVDAFAPHVKSLMRAVELAGGEIGGMVFNPLSAARATLTHNQKELGAVLIDVGFGTTNMAVYEENKLLALQAFPVGAANITNDLATAFKIPVGAAESLKLHYGYAMGKEVGSKESIELNKFFPEAKGNISRRFVAEIIEMRLAEILEFVNNELTLLGRSGKLAGGAVLVGGGAKLPGFTELAKQELRLASQIGFAIGAGWIREGVVDESGEMEDPEFVNALGLVLWGGDQEGWWDKKPDASFANLRELFRKFLP